MSTRKNKAKQASAGGLKDLHKGLRKFFIVPAITTLAFPLLGFILSFIYPSFNFAVGIKANIAVIAVMYLLLFGIRTGGTMGMVDLSKKETHCIEKAMKVYPFILITIVIYIAVGLLQQLNEPLVFNIVSAATIAICEFMAIQIARLPFNIKG